MLRGFSFRRMFCKKQGGSYCNIEQKEYVQESVNDDVKWTLVVFKLRLRSEVFS